MKLINKIMATALVVPMMVGVTACKDTFADYTPAEQLAEAQVYIPNNISTDYSVDMNDSVFYVTLSRNNADKDFTLKLVTDGRDSMLVVPTSVTFPKDSTKASIRCLAKVHQMGYDNAQTFTLSIADSTYASPYGKNQVDITVTAPAPWTKAYSKLADWVKDGYAEEDFPLASSDGTCNYTYKQFFSGVDKGLGISYRVNIEDPTQGQFIIYPWGSYESLEKAPTLTINYNTETHVCTVPETYIGYDHSSYGSVYVADVRTHWPTSTSDEDNSYYDPETGKFSLNVAYYVSAGYFGYGEETIQVNGYYIPDYSVDCSYEGILTDPNGAAYAQLIVNSIGVDAKLLLGTVVDASEDIDVVADSMVAHPANFTTVHTGVNNFALNDKTGEMRLIVVALDAEENGTKQGVYSFYFTYYGGGKEPWQSLGKGYFTDDIVLPFWFNIEPPTYEVEVQENTDKAGYYRLVNPYAEGVFPYSSEDIQQSLAKSGLYLYVNACDPDGVYVETQDLGMNWGDYGEMFFCSTGADYLSYYGPDYYDAIKATGLFGTLSNGTISFPTFTSTNDDGESLNYQGILYLGEVSDNSSYYTGSNGGIKIVLPSASASVKAAAKARARRTASQKMFRMSTPTKKDQIKHLRFAKPLLMKDRK